MEQCLTEANNLVGEKLWGAAAIAQYCGVSEQTIRRKWSKLADCPISKPHGQFFAEKKEIRDWMKNG